MSSALQKDQDRQRFRPLSDFDNLLTEDEVCRRYPLLLGERGERGRER